MNFKGVVHRANIRHTKSETVLDLRSTIPNELGETKVENVTSTILDTWTIEHQNVKEEIQRFSNGIGNDFYKTFIPEFFLKYPFIQFNGNRHCIDNRLLKRTVHEFLFTCMIEYPDIKSSFDNCFQKYIGKTLKDINIKHQIDKELKSDGNFECDFLIDDFLYAECKAIKFKSLAQVNPHDNILKNNLGDISKAFKQILSTANRTKTEHQECFGIILTYLPFYFSDGTDIWDIINLDIEQFLTEKSVYYADKT